MNQSWGQTALNGVIMYMLNQPYEIIIRTYSDSMSLTSSPADLIGKLGEKSTVHMSKGLHEMALSKQPRKSFSLFKEVFFETLLRRLIKITITEMISTDFVGDRS